jgi:hypothetical protein
MKVHVNTSISANDAGALRTALRGLSVSLALQLLGSAANATESAELTAQFIRAAQRFEAARAGSPTATPAAQAAFRDLLEHDPQNPLFLAYFGSTLAMEARDGRLPWQRIKEIRDSIATINKALGLLRPEHDRMQMRGLPVSLETRLVAIATFVALPEVFHCLPDAKQQLAVAMQSPVFSTAATELRGRFFYEAALIAEAEGDAERERAALKQVLAYAPPSLDLNEVRARLARLGG